MSEESTNPEEQVSKSSKEQGSKDQVFNKILNEDDPKERSQWIDFYKVIIEDEEQTEQRKLLTLEKIFSYVMIFLVFIAVVSIVVWVLEKEKPAGNNGTSALCLSPYKQQVNLCKTYLLSLKRE